MKAMKESRLPKSRRRFKRSAVAKWFAALDRLNTEPFMKNGRKQPKAPGRKIFR